MRVSVRLTPDQIKFVAVISIIGINLEPFCKINVNLFYLQSLEREEEGTNNGGKEQNR